MSYQTLLNALARTVGGTQPDNAHTSIPAPKTINGVVQPDQRPFWFSGVDAGDGSGVAGLSGCWSVPTEKFAKTPVAMILPDSWAPDPQFPFPLQGHKYRDDRAVVRVFTGNAPMQVAIAQLNGFADTITDAFDHHMQAFGETGVTTVDCSTGRFLEVNWGGAAYFAIDFRVVVYRGLPVTRTP
jgi:hypothetical protein